MSIYQENKISPANIYKRSLTEYAHELGHGLFTLLHTFDVNYSGGEYQSRTPNLMDYASGAELAAFQWNIMANPAPLTWFDSEQDAMFFQELRDGVKNRIKEILKNEAVNLGEGMLSVIMLGLYVDNFVDWSYTNWQRSDMITLSGALKAFVSDSDVNNFVRKVAIVLAKYTTESQIAELMQLSLMSFSYNLASADIPKAERIAQSLIASNRDANTVIFGLLFEFKYGIGPETREFGENSVMTQGIKDFYLVEKGRDEFYNEPLRKQCADSLPMLYNNPVKIEDHSTGEGAFEGKFGASGLLSAGFDLVGQYVGGFYMEMLPDKQGETMEMILYNKVNLKSLALHYFKLNEIPGIEPFPEKYPRIDGQLTPLGETLQILRWREPIDANRLK